MQYFLTAAGTAGLGAYLVARGRTVEILKANAAQYAVLSALVWPATAAWGIVGLAVAAVAAPAAGAAYMFAAVKRLGARPPVVLRPAVPAALAAVAAAPALLIGANPWIRVTAGLAIYSVVYIAVALRTAALRRGDLEMLGKALARMPAARSLIALLTRYAKE
ncbi:MAG: polysaccharide biosynthesis C-terminal domain-containing protein [Thermoproteus sp.]|nr:polysaccharide biosynthesis C-terminal domain-containing protein [Thermoproteus sp.]